MDVATKKHGNRYPWTEWFKQDEFTIRRYVNYYCRTDSMAQTVRAAARRHNLLVSISYTPNDRGLVVRVFGRVD